MSLYFFCYMRQLILQLTGKTKNRLIGVFFIGAENGIRTRGPRLGKAMLYH